MSLTSELRDPNSILGAFLRKYLEPKNVIQGINNRIRASMAVPLRSGVKAANLIGTAIDYRIRLYFKEDPFYRLVAWKGLFGNASILENAMWYKFQNGALEYFARFNDDLERLKPMGKLLSSKDEDLLCRHCLVLAKLEHAYRSGGYTVSSEASEQDRKFFGNFSYTNSRESGWRIKKVLNSFFTKELNEIKDMSRLFFENKQDWIKTKRVSLNPTFERGAAFGGADGDLIIDEIYYEIKSTMSGIQGRDVFQIMLYPLLDETSAYVIKKTGFYLARCGFAVEWPLEELYKKVAKTDISFLKFKNSFSKISDKCFDQQISKMMTRYMGLPPWLRES